MQKEKEGKLNHTKKYVLRVQIKTFIVIMLIFCLMAGCKRTKTGKLVGAHMTMSWDKLINEQKIDKLNYAGIVIVELKNGTKVNAICNTSIWFNLRGGQMLKIARFDSGVSTPDLRKGKEGRDIEVKWKVVEIVKKSEVDIVAIKSLLNKALEQTKIAFVSDRDGDNDIYVMNADGGEQTNLTKNPARDSSPSWSPDGKKIAFHSERDGNFEIYVMNADGSEQTNLTKNPAHDESLSWSPDGKKIAFVSIRDGDYEIYVMNADGSEQTKLTKNPARDLSPSWSPDGKKIAFHSERDGNSEIYVMNADGSEKARLTNNPALDESPSWSPFLKKGK